MRLLSRPSITLTLAVLLGGCASFGARGYHGPTSDHFDGRRFHNLQPYGDAAIGDALRRALSILEGSNSGGTKWVIAPTDTPPPRVGGGRVRVTFVNHATLLVQMDSLNILTDPIWSERASPVRWAGPQRHAPPGIRFEDLPPIDVVLISHNHYDHMDLPTLRRLVAAHHPRIVTGLGNAAYLARHGVPGAQDIDWWQSVALAKGVRLTGVPARHWSARSIDDKWRTLWLGFVIESVSGPVYFAGDTGFGEFFTTMRARFGPLRLALLPIAPLRPRSVMAPRHMSPGDAVRAYEVLGVSTAIAMHFGTFRQGEDRMEEPVDSLARAVKEVRPCAVRFWALYNGAARDVPPMSTRPACPGRASAAALVIPSERSRPCHSERARPPRIVIPSERSRPCHSERAQRVEESALARPGTNSSTSRSARNDDAPRDDPVVSRRQP